MLGGPGGAFGGRGRGWGGGGLQSRERAKNVKSSRQKSAVNNQRLELMDRIKSEQHREQQQHHEQQQQQRDQEQHR